MLLVMMVTSCHLPKEEWNPFYHSAPVPGYDPTTGTITNNAYLDFSNTNNIH